MSRLMPSRPLLIILYGYPGSGKTHFGREISEKMHAAHVNGDRIRAELFDKPSYSKQENQFVAQFMNYMTEEFLKAGVSVVYDINSSTLTKRRLLKTLAKKCHAEPLLVWLQIDLETSYFRAVTRDRRKIDDKYAMSMTRPIFDDITRLMQNPTRDEDYIVISGKHTFNTQQSAIVKKLHNLGLLTSNEMTSNVIRPELVNLVPPKPFTGRVDMTRRNINIR